MQKKSLNFHSTLLFVLLTRLHPTLIFAWKKETKIDKFLAKSWPFTRQQIKKKITGIRILSLKANLYGISEFLLVLFFFGGGQDSQMIPNSCSRIVRNGIVFVERKDESEKTINDEKEKKNYWNKNVWWINR